MTEQLCAVGIDIGGTKTEIAYKQNGAPVSLSRFPTPEDPETAVDLICTCIESGDLPDKPAAVGIGCPGPLDYKTGVILTPPNLLRWHGFSLTDAISDRLGVPARLDNDGNLGALGEASCGCGIGHETVLYFAVGTGLGAGLVEDGAIVRGRSGCASEIWAFEPTLFDGSRGATVNDIASGKGLVREVKKAISNGYRSDLAGDFTARDIASAYRRGDQAAEEAFRRARDTLTAVIIFSVTLIDPDIVILGGGMCDDPELFVQPVQNLYPERMPVADLKGTPIVRSRLGGGAVLMGAISMAEGR